MSESPFFMYLFWELAISALAFSISYLAVKKENPKQTTSYIFLVALSLKLWINAVAPQSAAFFGGATYNFLFWFACASGVLAILLVHRITLLGYEEVLDSSRNKSTAVPLAALGFALLIGPILAAVIAVPLFETDSVVHTHYIKGFSTGLSPFAFPFNYVALWESAYIPGFVLGQSQKYYSLTSLQPALIIGIVSYLISREFYLDRLPAMLVAFTALTTEHIFGVAPTGIGTLKNDIAYAAGILLLVYACLRIIRDSKIAPSVATIILAGTTFASVKFSGPVLSLLMAIIFGGVFFKELKSIKWDSWARLGGVVFVCFLTTGVYYLRNIIEFGNPLYPFVTNIFGVSLFGIIEPSGTRIIDYLFHPELWRAFFKLIPSKTGLGALYYLLGLLVIFFILVFSRQASHGQGIRKSLLFICSITLLMWLLFLQTPWSAGVSKSSAFPNGDFFYISEHNSFRYVLSAIQLSIIVVVASLFNFANGRLRLLGYIAVLVDLCFRMYYLHALSPKIYLAIPVVLIVYVIILSMNMRAVWAVLISSLAVVASIPALYEINKFRVGKQLLAMDRLPKQEEACSAASLIWPASENTLSVKLSSHALATIGSDFVCRYAGEISTTQLAENQSGDTPPDYIVATTFLGNSFSENDLAIMDAVLNRQGFSLVVNEASSVVFTKLKSEPYGKIKKIPHPVDLWKEFPAHFLGSSDKKLPRISEYTFATELPAAIFTVGSAGVRRVEVSAGDIVELRNVEDNSVAKFHLQNGNWTVLNKKDSAGLYRRYLHALPESLSKKDGTWQISGPGRFEYSVEMVDGRHIVKVRALEDMPWLAAILNAKNLTNTSGQDRYFAEVEFSSSGPLLMVLQAYDFEGDKVSTYYSKPVVLQGNIPKKEYIQFEFGKTRKQDYFAVTAEGIKAGQDFVIYSSEIYSSSWPKILFRNLVHQAN